MSRTGSIQHEEEVKKAIDKYTKNGYRCIDLKGLSPDVIAVQKNRICVIEIHGHKKGYKQKSSMKQIREKYSMFDEVFIEKFVYEILSYF